MNYLQYGCKVSNETNLYNYIEPLSVDIFHYTSPNGITGIINNKKLRFSDRLYLNDASEGKYILDFTKKHIDMLGIDNVLFRSSLLEKLDNKSFVSDWNRFYVYQCSFSLDGDSLPLWNYYSKSDGIKGYNLCFNSNELASNLKPDVKEGKEAPRIYHGKIMYDEEEQNTAIIKLVKRFYGAFQNSLEKDSGIEFTSENAYAKMMCSLLVDKIILLGAFMKPSFFSFEREYRLVYDLYLDEEGYGLINNKQGFMEKSGFFVPYTDIEFEPSILKQIRISPTVDFNMARMSLLRYLQSDFSHITEDRINKSIIPVRY